MIAMLMVLIGFAWIMHKLYYTPDFDKNDMRDYLYRNRVTPRKSPSVMYFRQTPSVTHLSDGHSSGNYISEEAVYAIMQEMECRRLKKKLRDLEHQENYVYSDNGSRMESIEVKKYRIDLSKHAD